MKTPKNRNLSWVRCHCLNERPDQQNEDEVEKNKQGHNSNWLRGSRTPQHDLGVVDEYHDFGNQNHKNIAQNFSRSDR